jgi:alpha-beta hydrolase superfamily lysophospholipase
VVVPIERTIDVPSGSLVVHHWCSAAAPHFLTFIAHGYAEHARRYDHVASRLVDAGSTVIAPDQRGHGRSSGARGLMADMDGYAADLRAVMAAFHLEFPSAPRVLIGHSMGGLIATRLVQLFPGSVDALVLSGPVVGGNPDVFALADVDPIPDAPVDPSVLSRDLAVGAAFAADPLVYHGPYRPETLAAYKAAVARVAEGPGFGALPTLWIHGGDDRLAPLAPTRTAIERLKGSRFEQIIYAESRHEIFNEIDRDVVIDDVLAFVLRELAGVGIAPAKTGSESANLP